MEEPKERKLELESEDNEDYQDTDARYRDLELEENQAKDQILKQEAEIEAELEAYEKQQEQNLISEIRGNTRKELTKNQVNTEIKNVKKSKDKKLSSKRKVKAYQRKKRERQNLVSSNIAKKKPLLQKIRRIFAKPIVKKVFKLADKGGKDLSKRRNVKHDLSMGAETKEQNFTTTIDGVTVSGKITVKTESETTEKSKNNNPKILDTKSQEKEVKIDKVVKDDHEVSSSDLGNISPDKVNMALEKEGQLLEK